MTISTDCPISAEALKKAIRARIDSLEDIEINEWPSSYEDYDIGEHYGEKAAYLDMLKWLKEGDEK
jgi:hypothetical protein